MQDAVIRLSQDAFEEVTRAEAMVRGRKGRGGSQPAEVERMLASESARAASDLEWARREAARLAASVASLDAALSALAASA